LKVAIIVAGGLLLAGGAMALAGVYYAAHAVHQKIQQVTGSKGPAPAADAGLMGKLEELTHGSSGSTSETKAAGDDSSASGDPCRYLTKEEVGVAINATMTRVESKPDGCVYYAQGDAASMVTKHTGALLSSHGVSPKNQQALEKVAGAFFEQQQNSDKTLSSEAATGEVPVLAINFSRGNAEAEFRMNANLMGKIGEGPKSVDGVGNQAFQLAETTMIFRKGQTLVRLTYPECPCNTQSITPLARKLADRL
jgi:hypothetical protein